MGNVCAKHPELEGRRYRGGNCPACVKEYRRKHREKYKAMNDVWRANNAERVKEFNKAWRDANKDIIKNNNLRRIGFTLQKLRETLEAQNHLCAICGVDLRDKPPRHTHADHCHTTNKPRGVLCHYCNAGLGHFKDNPELLRKAAEYLELHNLI